MVELWLEECGSTQDEAKRLAKEGAASLSYVVARRQTAGRGRIQRTWESPDGNLYASILIRGVSPQGQTWIGSLVALAVLQEFPGLGISIKWPNDLWHQEQKLGGILCEGVIGPSGTYVIAGLGLNVSAAPKSIDQAATDLRSIGSPREISDFWPSIVKRLAKLLDRIAREEPSNWLIPELLAHWYFRVGERIQWRDSRPEVRTGEVCGLGPQGELLVQVQSGDRLRLTAGDVSRVRREDSSGSCGSLP